MNVHLALCLFSDWLLAVWIKSLLQILLFMAAKVKVEADHSPHTLQFNTIHRGMVVCLSVFKPK